MFLTFVIFFPVTAFAHTEGGLFSEAENIIEEQTPCDQLTTEQLDHLGDYYMEQIHPGGEHEIMDVMMGGDGSDNLVRMHSIMAQRFYCNDDQKGALEGSILPKVIGGMMRSINLRAENKNIPATVQPQNIKQSFWQSQISVQTLFGWILVLGGIGAVWMYTKKK